jgi:magnesium chelatase subunit D
VTTPGEAPSRIADARLAAALVSIDPGGLGGVSLRAGHGPLRDQWIAAVRAMLPQGAPVVRLPFNISEDRLEGGVDLAASLAEGRLCRQASVLDAIHGGVALLPMAERVETGLAARLAAVMDHAASRAGARPAFGLIALDEGRAPEEQPPTALMDRLALRVDLTGDFHRTDAITPLPRAEIAAARDRLPDVAEPEDALVTAVCEAALAFGVASLRSVIFTLKAARAHAALAGRSAVGREDLAAAARLVLAPRATQAPAAPDTEESEANTPPPDDPQTDHSPSDIPPPESDNNGSRDEPENLSREEIAEILVAALRALAPEIDVSSQHRRPARARLSEGGGGGGGGAPTFSLRRGRPIAARAGALGGGARLDLVATLRAAAPWQRLRAASGDTTRLSLRKDDIRIRRFVRRAELTTVFVVDASGSTAFQRLAEAKGAVEQLLARAYVSRARAALIAFHHAKAGVLLPPTRSLTRAKRLLADLPGGGGTPLSLAMDAALTLTLSERAKQRTPMLVFLTDGRANIDGRGEPGRGQAEADAMNAARKVGASGVRTLFIDTALRPRPEADRFAKAMGGAYAFLPLLESRAVADLVTREGGRALGG